MKTCLSLPGIRKWSLIAFLAFLSPVATSCGVVYVPLQPYPLIGEGPPPGYTGGTVPERYSAMRDPFLPTDQTALQAGKSLYASHEPSCATCHGDRGHGDGPLAAYLEPQPADFTAPPMLNAFRNHQPYVYWWVSEGVAKSPMPAWHTRMSETERWQVITYAWSLGEQGTAGASSPGGRGASGPDGHPGTTRVRDDTGF